MTIRSSRSDRRRFLRESALATAGIAGGVGFRPQPIAARPQQALTASRGQGTKSLSRQFAEWVVRLRYEDLPAAVVDRAKGLTLQNLASALVGSQMASAKQAMAFVAEEESGVSNGGTIMVSGAKVTRGGAAFANAEMMFAGSAGSVGSDEAGEIIPSHQMTLFGPRITIFTNDCKSYTRQATGREFIWDFDEEVRRIRPVAPGLPISSMQFERVIAACRDLEREPTSASLVGLTIAV